MAAPSDALFGGWYPNNQFLIGDVRQSWDNGETWAFSGLAFTYPALRIGVSEARAVPEPGTFALLGAGLVVMIGLMRRRRTAR